MCHAPLRIPGRRYTTLWTYAALVGVQVGVHILIDLDARECEFRVHLHDAAASLPDKLPVRLVPFASP